MNHEKEVQYLKSVTRSIQDYPKEGIVFRDLTTIFQEGKAFSKALDMMADSLEGRDSEFGPFEKLAGPRTATVAEIESIVESVLRRGR